MKKQIVILIVTALFVLQSTSNIHAVGVQSPAAQDTESDAQETDAVAVLAALADAINGGDAEALAALFAEGSVSVALPPPPNSNGVSLGREEIGAGWAAVIARNAEVVFTDFRVYDNKVTWTVALTEDVFRYIGAYPIYFRAVGVVEDGAIQSMTWIMHKESIAQLEAAGQRTIANRVIEEAWNQNNLVTVDELYAADTIYHLPDHGELVGTAAVKDLISAFRTAFPDLQFTIEQQVVEGDLVATRWAATGTHQGDYMGIAPTGNAVTLFGITLFQITTVDRVEERQIVESWSYWNSLGLLEQLGVATLATE